MGHRNTLSGHIQEVWYVEGSDQAIERLWEHNRHVLDSLPDDGEEKWPYLVVVLVTEWMGHHVCRWDAKTDTFDAENPTPITEWTFEGPRDFR